MPHTSRISLWTFAVTTWVLLGAEQVAADEPTDVERPTVTKAEQAHFPDGADRISREVRMRVSIDAAGKVTDVEIVQSAGEAFDREAERVARATEFVPAKKHGTPIASKIPFVVMFEPPKESAPAPSTPVVPSASTVIAGTIATEAKQAVPGAHLTITVGPVTRETSTNDKGAFSLENLPIGPAHLEVTLEGFASISREITLAEKNAPLSLVLSTDSTKQAISVEIIGEKPMREPTRVTLKQEELTHIPGTNGDPVSAIQNLPGMGRAPSMSGLVIIRGSSPSSSAFFVDGTEVPLLYHLDGITSFVPAEMLERVDLYPGNFSAENGRVRGGVVDIGLKSPSSKWSAIVETSALNGRAVVEGPIGSRTRVAIAARRSWLDVFLELASAGRGTSISPVYFDYQALIEHDFSANTKARIALFGSDDRIKVLSIDPSANDPSFGGSFSSVTSFWRLQARLETRLSKDSTWTNTLAFGSDNLSTSFGQWWFDEHQYPLTLRSQFRSRLSKELTLTAGFEWMSLPFHGTIRMPDLPGPGHVSGSSFGEQFKESSLHGTMFRPAAFAVAEFSPFAHLRLLPSIRVDYTRETDRWTVDPRFAFRYDIFTGALRTTLKGGAGLYRQTPSPAQSIAPFGTPHLHSEVAAQYSLGVEQTYSAHLFGSLEGFYRDCNRLIVSQVDPNATYGVSYNNAGIGRAYGLEVLLRYMPDDRFFGWIAYTLSRSEIKPGADEPWRVFAYDQTHVLTAVASYKLGKGWQVGARFRFVTGNPYTPMVGAYEDFDSGTYAPISAFPPRGSRMPAFHQLDLRVDKTWTFRHWKLTTYLDLQNVYNQQNPEAVQYNYNYSKSNLVSILPIFPIIGVRADL